ncbi:MAG: hypothetical protein FD180_1514 [Planctomycetota bacterium]|nr:MAG: hypothetical protein FD180_1514 [Planctomycetota bacterium]
MQADRSFAAVLFAAAIFARFPCASGAQEWKIDFPGDFVHADEKRLVFLLSDFKVGRFLVALDPATGTELWRWKEPNNQMPGAVHPLGSDRLHFDQGILDLTTGKVEASPCNGTTHIRFDRLNCWDGYGIRAFGPDLAKICDWKSTMGNPDGVGIAADAFYAVGKVDGKAVLVKVGIDGKLAWTTPEPELNNEFRSVQPTRSGAVAILKTGARVFSLDKGKPGKTWLFPKPVTSVEGMTTPIRLIEDSTGTYVAWLWKEVMTTGTGKNAKTSNQSGLRLLDVERGWRKLRTSEGNIIWYADRFDFRDGLVLLDPKEGPVLWNYAKDTEESLPPTGFAHPGMASGAGLMALVRLDVDKKQAILQVRKLATAEGAQEWPVGTETWATTAIAEAGLTAEKATARPIIRRLKRGFMVCLVGRTGRASYYVPDGAGVPAELGDLERGPVPCLELEDRISVFVSSAGSLTCRTASFKR